MKSQTNGPHRRQNVLTVTWRKGFLSKKLGENELKRLTIKARAAVD